MRFVDLSIMQWAFDQGCGVLIMTTTKLALSLADITVSASRTTHDFALDAASAAGRLHVDA